MKKIKNYLLPLLFVFSISIISCSKDDKAEEDEPIDHSLPKLATVKFWIHNDDNRFCNISVVIEHGATTFRTSVTGALAEEPDGCYAGMTDGIIQDLGPGTYSFTASCWNGNWSGSFTISGTECVYYRL